MFDTEENIATYENPVPAGLALYVNGPKRKRGRKRRKGKLPAGLARYWAKKRGRRLKKHARKSNHRRKKRMPAGLARYWAKKRGPAAKARAAARVKWKKHQAKWDKSQTAKIDRLKTIRRKRRQPAGLAAYWAAQRGVKKMAKKRRRKSRARRGHPRRKARRVTRRRRAAPRRARRRRHLRRGRGRRNVLVYGRPIRMNPSGMLGAVTRMLKDGVPGCAIAALEELYVVDPVLALAKVPTRLRGVGIIGFGLVQAILVSKFAPRMSRHAAIAFHGLLTSGLKETIAGFLGPATATKTADLVSHYEGLVSSGGVQPVNGLLSQGQVPSVMDAGDGFRDGVEMMDQY